MDRDQAAGQAEVGGEEVALERDGAAARRRRRAPPPVRFEGATGIGIAADSRTNAAYQVWACAAGGNDVLAIPASTIKPMKMDVSIPNANWPTIRMPCFGVSVDANQDVWGISQQTTTRALVDRNGAITQPVVNGAPMGNNRCPAGDSCANVVAEAYSDNVGWPIHSGDAPPNYSIVLRGCHDGQGAALPTEWGNLTWDADTPGETRLDIYVQSGSSSDLADPSWRSSTFTGQGTSSPVCLQESLTPNVKPSGPLDAQDGWLHLQLVFRGASGATGPRYPKLKSFQVTYRCLQ